MKQELMDAILETPVIAAVKDDAGLCNALTNENIRVVFVLYGDICNISSIVRRIHEAGRFAVVHVDLIAGLAGKEVAVDFIRNTTEADGIISTRQSFIRRAKELGLAAILRVFLLDSIALESLDKIPANLPDCLDLLPGAMPKILRRVCAKAKVPVLTTKEVALAIEFEGVPGAAADSIVCDIAPKTVRLNGEADVLASIDKLVLATLHVDDLGLHQQNSYVVTPPDGTWLVNGNEVATADITLDGISETTLTVTDLSFTDLPAGLYAVVPEGGLTVRLWGLSEEIEAITAENLRATADMSAVTGQGSFTVPVTVRVSGFSEGTGRGTYELTLTITDTPPQTEPAVPAGGEDQTVPEVPET